MSRDVFVSDLSVTTAQTATGAGVVSIRVRFKFASFTWVDALIPIQVMSH